MSEIQVIVPWGKTNNLGSHYNRLMEKVDDWVCFLDHDILMLNPNWYHMCLSAIDRVGHTAGWITGVTNAIACPHQLDIPAPKGSNIEVHMRRAKQLYNKHGNTVTVMDQSTLRLPFSGFMILTHREAWEAAGGFMDGFLGVDNHYYTSVVKKGYSTYIMPGLYMYHLYGTKHLWKTF